MPVGMKYQYLVKRAREGGWILPTKYKNLIRNVT